MKNAVKTILATLLCAAMLLGLGAAAFADNGVAASGECGADGGNVTWTLYKDGTLVIDGSGKMADFLSPSLDGSGGSPWYSERYSITKVVINEGVTRIGRNSFLNCSSLSSVSIPASVKSIGDEAFWFCCNLKKIALGEGSGSFALDNGVLMSKDGTKLILYPASRTGAAYTVPSTVSEICSGAFAYAQNLSSVTIPTNVRKICPCAFSYVIKLTDLTIENGVKTIGNGAFGGSHKINAITIPASVTSIGRFAFAECVSVNRLTFKGHAPKIGAYAFEYVTCTAYYPGNDNTWTSDKLQNYGGDLIWRVIGSDDILATGECGENGSNVLWTMHSDGTMELTGSGRMMAFEPSIPSMFPWGEFSNHIKKVVVSDGITNIGAKAFYGCRKLKSISLPKGLKSIDYAAFSSCLWLTSVNFPSSLKTIDGEAFNHCEDLSDISLPNALKTIGDYAFEHCPIAEITIPGSVKTIGVQAFSFCYSLKKINFAGNAPTNISDMAFHEVTAKAYYPAGDKTWTSDKLQNYGGKLTWKSVEAKPVIKTQPKDVTVAKGKTASFSVKADGATSFQWYYRTSPSGAWTKVKNNGASAKYNLTTAERHNGYQYRCRVKNASGSVYSDIVTLTVVTKPKITVQPVSTCVGPNYSARFTVEAEGEGLSYQWYYLKTGETTWRKVTRNGTSATYVLNIAANHNGYKYKCVVTNAAGSVESKTATLTVG